MKHQLFKRNGQRPYVPHRHREIYAARQDPHKVTEGAGRSALQASLHHLPAVLANCRGVSWLKIQM